MPDFGNIAAGVGPYGAQQTYGSVYNNWLNTASSLYNSAYQGYQNIMGYVQGAYGSLAQGYSNLSNDVLGRIQGVDASALQAAKDLYAKQQGATQQGAISKGLGNSTVLDSLSRGNTLDYSKAYTAIKNEFAQTEAGYESQFGLAALNAQQQGIAANTALGAQQAGMASQYLPPAPGGIPSGPGYPPSYGGGGSRGGLGGGRGYGGGGDGGDLYPFPDPYGRVPQPPGGLDPAGVAMYKSQLEYDSRMAALSAGYRSPGLGYGYDFTQNPNSYVKGNQGDVPMAPPTEPPEPPTEPPEPKNSTDYVAGGGYDYGGGDYGAVDYGSFG